VPVKVYDSSLSWNGSELHFVDCDVGPGGDVSPGKVSIRGDRWKHRRIGLAHAPSAQLLQPVKAARIELITRDVSSASPAKIYVSRTEGFEIGERCILEDDDGSEEITISEITENRWLEAIVSGNYRKDKKGSVYQIKRLVIAQSGEFAVGDLLLLEHGGMDTYTHTEIYKIDTSEEPDNTIIEVKRLFSSFEKDDLIVVYNTITGWVRDLNNPITGLKSESLWDWAGYGVKSVEYMPEVDIQNDNKGKELWKKSGLWFTGQREASNPQIGMMLSCNEDDIENWTQFLGDENSSRLNPIIRHSSDMEYFNYISSQELQRIWNTEDAGISVSIDASGGLDGTTAMKIDYTETGEVWGLVPVPFNAEIRSEAFDGNNDVTRNIFRFKVKGDAGNSRGDIYIRFISADGSSFIHNFPDALSHASYTDKTFSFSSFSGRKYVRAVVVGISLSESLSNSETIYIDHLQPFMPPSWDELIEDPTIIRGDMLGTFACYYGARSRPRELLTGFNSGSTNVVCDIGDTSSFNCGETVVLYDRNNYEIGRVDAVNSSTRLTIKHVNYDDDRDAILEHEYDPSFQAMIANNTCRTSKKIGVSYVLAKDCSKWSRWIIDADSRVILEPGPVETDWDSLLVEQPCVRRLGNTVYMAYVGMCSGSRRSIGFAKSTDFTTFEKLEGNPYIKPAAGGFDSHGCKHPDMFMKPPYNVLTYSGHNGEFETIGSAVSVNKIHDSYSRFHVTLLLYPCASTGYPPQDGSVLFDMGNFKIDLDKRNRVSATAIVDGKLTTTGYIEPSEGDHKIGWGSRLVHDRWNVIIANFDGKNIECYLVNQAQCHSSVSVWTNSPWHLVENVIPAGTTCIVERKYGWIDAPEVDQECIFYGFGTEDKYDLEKHFQYNFISGVSSIAGTDRFILELSNPAGPWGFSRIYAGTSGGDTMGLLLSQGYYPAYYADTVGWDTVLKATDVSGYMNVFNDVSGLFDGSIATVKSSGKHKISDNYVKLDQSMIRPVQIGSNSDQSSPDQSQNLFNMKTWTGGYFGHIDIGLDNPSEEDAQKIYNILLSNNVVPSLSNKPKWHKFNLVHDGGTPAIFTSTAYWELTDYDGKKFPDKVGENHLYLVGASAETIADGFLGRTFRFQNQSGEVGDVLFITDDFFKKGEQFSESSGWDDTSVEAPNLFKSNDGYHLFYTGLGTSPYEYQGEIIGDLFEAPRITAGVTIDGNFFVPSDSTVSIYLSWEKKTRWGDPVWQTSIPGEQSTGALFFALPGMTTDFHYNVRWKIKLQANPALDSSPIVNRFAVEYTDPGEVPSAEFIAAQNSYDSSPVFRVQHVLSSGVSAGAKIDMTDRIISISNITHEIPSGPDKLGNIVADDVTIIAENTDGYFSDSSGISPFYDRFYLDDEIRIFSGFRLTGGDEYQVTGRFLIDRIEIDNRGEAQIYCRSLLREALDKIVGEPSGNQPNPRVFKGNRKVKEIMTELLTGASYANINPENLYIEDFDRCFSNLTVEEETVGEVLQKLAQACDGVVYTDNQGDIYFKTWGSLLSGDYEIKPDINMIGLRYTGQRRDRLVKRAIVKGTPLVQGTCVSELGAGRDITIDNDFIQQTSWANSIAENIVSRYGQVERELELWSCYLPSVKILDTVLVSDALTGLSKGRYLVINVNKNITGFNESYKLVSNLASGD